MRRGPGGGALPTTDARRCREWIVLFALVQVRRSMAGPQARPPAEERPLLAELWATRAYRLFPLLLIYMSGERWAGRLDQMGRAATADAVAAPAGRRQAPPRDRLKFHPARLPAGVTLLIPHVPGAHLSRQHGFDFDSAAAATSPPGPATPASPARHHDRLLCRAAGGPRAALRGHGQGCAGRRRLPGAHAAAWGATGCLARGPASGAAVGGAPDGALGGWSPRPRGFAHRPQPRCRRGVALCGAGRARGRRDVEQLDLLLLQLIRLHSAGALHCDLHAQAGPRHASARGGAACRPLRPCMPPRPLAATNACNQRPRCRRLPGAPPPAQTPMLGHWSDMHGRKPFLLVSQVCVGGGAGLHCCPAGGVWLVAESALRAVMGLFALPASLPL